MYSAALEDYVVKCHDCMYTVECWESPEYYGNSSDGHWVDCPCGCYSFFEAHVFIYTMIANNVFYHNAYCRVCGDTYSKPHNWVSASGGYECSDCGMPTSIIPDYSSLSDEELSLLLSSMSEEEIEQFIALLPEDAVARVTAILPRDDEHLTE